MLIVSVAWRELLSVAVPRTVLPTEKVTSPVGVPEPGAEALTVAVKVKLPPCGAGLSEAVTAVVVPARATLTTVGAAVVAGRNVELPV